LLRCNPLAHAFTVLKIQYNTAGVYSIAEVA
jgi:hypothetical protein